jgi:threonine/homoserine/homoserine lactone efflux protein
MIDAPWLLFAATSAILIATPGQDMLLVMSRSLSQGPRAGVVTAGGVSLGLIGHTVLAALGLGAVLRTSEVLFVTLKLVGAAYLVYLAINLFRISNPELQLKSLKPRSLGRLFLDGAFSNISNPKVALVFFAFLPQFVSNEATHPTLTLLALGAEFAVLTFAIKGPVGLTAGLLSAWLRSRPRALVWLYRSAGTVLLGLGVRLALERRQ